MTLITPIEHVQNTQTQTISTYKGKLEMLESIGILTKKKKKRKTKGDRKVSNL